MAEVIGCIAAVVSAFHGGAELVKIINERKEKKKRRKQQEIEQLVEARMLHSSLVQGERECENCRAEGHRLFGQAFDRGDQIATSQLKDVVIHLQGEVLRALQIALQVESAVLNVPQLYEASIMDRSVAIQSMHELQQRIMVRLPPQRQLAIESMQFATATAGLGIPTMPMRRTVSDASVDSFHTAIGANALDLPAAVSIPGRPSSSNQQPPFSRMTSVRSTAGSLNWVLPHIRRSDADTSPFANWPVDEDAGYDVTQDLGRLSMQDPVRGEVSPRHRPSASIDSATSHDVGEEMPQPVRSETIASASTASVSIPLTPTSSAASMASSKLQEPEVPPNHSSSAPEVVTKEYEPMLSPRARPPLHLWSSLPPPSNVHPAFRDPYFDSLTPQSPEQAPPADPIWAPLQRPARINNYHGFCKGAWQTREHVQEGLSIAMIRHLSGYDAPWWKCKHCEFRSKATNSASELPDHVLFLKGVRYRWLFLAKSHIPAAKPHSKAEEYKYGCIFCAAQGHETSTYLDLDALMNHVLSKHKTTMLTPQVLAKTRCVVGGVPDRAEDHWDINLPETRSPSVGSAMSKHFAAAVTGISDYGMK